LGLRCLIVQQTTVRDQHNARYEPLAVHKLVIVCLWTEF
jgi:hypothetical protein